MLKSSVWISWCWATLVHYTCIWSLVTSSLLHKYQEGKFKTNFPSFIALANTIKGNTEKPAGAAGCSGGLQVHVCPALSKEWANSNNLKLPTTSANRIDFFPPPWETCFHQRKCLFPLSVQPSSLRHQHIWLVKKMQQSVKWTNAREDRWGQAHLKFWTCDTRNFPCC